MINQDTRQWDRGKLFTTFDQRTSAEILALALNHLNSQDTLIWKENKAHEFSVRTTYQVALRLKNTSAAEHSSARVHGVTWTKIWKLKVPPKVRTFLWRACPNCLPTRDNLSRKLQVEAICEFCRQEPETVTHLLWVCPFARNVWGLFRGRIQKCSNDAEAFFLLFKHWQTQAEHSELT